MSRTEHDPLTEEYIGSIESLGGDPRRMIQRYLWEENTENYSRLVGEVLVEVPGYWEFQEYGFKKIDSVSVMRLDSVVEALASERDLELPDKPRRTARKNRVAEEMKDFSTAFTALSNVAGEEFEGQRGRFYRRKYSADDFSERHWQSLQKALDAVDTI